MCVKIYCDLYSTNMLVTVVEDPREVKRLSRLAQGALADYVGTWILVCDSFNLWFLRDGLAKSLLPESVKLMHVLDLSEVELNYEQNYELLPIPEHDPVLPTVSLLTVTRGNRTRHFDSLVACVTSQTYANITEWIVVNGSQSEEEALALDAYFGRPHVHAKLRYDPTRSIGQRIGAMRNRLMAQASGEIWVWMDDDDYYFPDRVSHAVERLVEAPHRDVAATEDNIMFDPRLTVPFQFLSVTGQMFANNSMAMRGRMYTERGRRYCENVTHNEESSITAGFSEPVVRLEPRHTVFQITHGSNTVGKRSLYENSIIPQPGRGPYMTPVADEADEVIPAWFYTVKVDPKEAPDVEYYCGSSVVPAHVKNDVAWIQENRGDISYGLYGVGGGECPDNFDMRKKHRVVVCAENSVNFMAWFRSQGILKCDALVGDVHTNVRGNRQLASFIDGCIASDPAVIRALHVNKRVLMSPLGLDDKLFSLGDLKPETVLVSDAGKPSFSIAAPSDPKHVPDMLISVAPSSYNTANILYLMSRGTVPILGEGVYPSIPCPFRVKTLKEACALADCLCLLRRDVLESARAAQRPPEPQACKRVTPKRCRFTLGFTGECVL